MQAFLVHIAYNFTAFCPSFCCHLRDTIYFTDNAHSILDNDFHCESYLAAFLTNISHLQGTNHEFAKHQPRPKPMLAASCLYAKSQPDRLIDPLQPWPARAEEQKKIYDMQTCHTCPSHRRRCRVVILIRGRLPAPNTRHPTLSLPTWCSHHKFEQRSGDIGGRT